MNYCVHDLSCVLPCVCVRMNFSLLGKSSVKVMREFLKSHHDFFSPLLFLSNLNFYIPFCKREHLSWW